jgi:hypothetical protein
MGFGSFQGQNGLFRKVPGFFLKFWEWLEGLGAKDGALATCEFLGYLQWLGPNHKYFSETEGPMVIFPNA